MAANDDLDRRIKERLAVGEERRQLRQNHVQQFMKEWEERDSRYTAVADRLVETVIRPRVKKLQNHFDNATFPQARNSRHTCFCQFEHCSRFPATVGLELGVTRDGQATTVIVQYKLEVVPVFFSFERCDQLSMPLGAMQEDKVTAWVEDKIVNFVETYLQLETASTYQAENVVTDPVCGMRLNKNHAPASMAYQGQVYYFCVEACRARFAENPAHFLVAKAADAN
jgi:YHS domain-containing protein